jgi:hypothetical protein
VSARPRADRSPSSTAPPRRRLPNRLAAGALAAVVAVGAGVVTYEVRAADAANAEEAARDARADMISDVEQLRVSVAEPARTGQTAATALLRQQLTALSGEDVDHDLVDRLVDDLRTAADELETAAGSPRPERPNAMPVALADPLLDRLDRIEQQATDVADRFRATADEAAEWDTTLRELSDAATTYAEAGGDLPASDEPAEVAAAWRTELDQLEVYADALDDAGADEVRPSLEGLADAQRRLIDGMSAVAEDAISLLDAGDVDGYATLLEDQLGGDARFGLSEALAEAREDIATQAVDGPLELTRARALGLLTELEDLRRTAPGALTS